MKKSIFLMCALSAALLMPGCGGGGNDSSSSGTQDPASLFPQGVHAGWLQIGQEDHGISLQITFRSSDFTMGADYQGGFSLSILGEENVVDPDSGETAQVTVAGFLRQTDESRPGHVVLFFTSSASETLYGPIVIALSAAGAQDDQHVRSGVVEDDSSIGFFTADGQRLKPQLRDLPVKITW